MIKMVLFFCSKCKNCIEFYNSHGKYCTVSCSKKGKEKTIANNPLTIIEIKRVLENNIGCYINHGNISIYSREIIKILKK